MKSNREQILRKYFQILYEQEFSRNEYDKYYFGLRYLGNRYLLSLLTDTNIKNKRILDIGSGRLTLSSFLSLDGASIVAYDLSEIIENKLVKERAKKYGVDLVAAIIEQGRTFKLPFKDCSFDIVLMTEVIEHLNFSPIFLLKQINRILKNDGYLILSTPNVHSLENKIKFILNKSVYSNCDRYLKGPSFDYHWREFEKRELFFIVNECNFKVIRSLYCNDILYNKYNSYLYRSILQKKIIAVTKKLIYYLTFIFPGLKKQIILFASKT